MICMCLSFLISNIEIIIVPDSLKVLRFKWANLYKAFLSQTHSNHSHPVKVSYSFWNIIIFIISIMKASPLLWWCHYYLPLTSLPSLCTIHLPVIPHHLTHWTCSLFISQHLSYWKVSCLVHSVLKYLLRFQCILEVDLLPYFIGFRMSIFPIVLYIFLLTELYIVALCIPYI